MNQNKVFIGIPTSEYGRMGIFHDYVANLIKPDDTIGASFHTNCAAMNRNLIIKEAQLNDCTHILFIDDDMAFAPDSLMRLLSHDKDVIGGLYFNRIHPHPPVLFDKHSTIRYIRHTMKDNEVGLIECEAVGFGFLLVNISVLDNLDEPFVRTGQIFPDARSEDIDFCLRLRNKGVRIYCDLDTVIGHMGSVTVWPNRINGVWHTSLDTQGNQLINIPQNEIEELRFY